MFSINQLISVKTKQDLPDGVNQTDFTKETSNKVHRNKRLSIDQIRILYAV